MFWNHFVYSFKLLFRNRMLIFWTFAFPILLGLFFYMAFQDIENNEKLDIIDIAVVQTDTFEQNRALKESFEYLSNKENKEQLFSTKYVDLEKADELLKNSKIDGYVLFEENKTNVIVKENGIQATVLKFAVDEMTTRDEIMKNIASSELEKLPKDETGNLNSFYAGVYVKALKLMENNDANIKDVSSDHLSYTMIEFYTLIAMTCLYGGILGMVSVNQNLANMSSQGKRMAVTPISKSKMILGSVLSSYIVQLIGVSLLFLFLKFLLHVDFGNHLSFIILLTLVGCLAGLSLGIFIASFVKSNENTKTGVILAITMSCCFLSGMMGITMKYIVDKYLPLINKINPANMITDGFYSLYYYDTFDRYFFNVVSLSAFSLVLIVLSYFTLRRQKYDNI